MHFLGEPENIINKENKIIIKKSVHKKYCS